MHFLPPPVALFVFPIQKMKNMIVQQVLIVFIPTQKTNTKNNNKCFDK